MLVVKDNSLLRGSRIIILEKLSFKELYSLLLSAIDHQPTSQKYFDNLFPNIELSWKEIYLIARNATVNSLLRSFHYKVINSVLYLSKKFFQFGKTPLCTLFVILRLTQRSMFFANDQLLKFFGINFCYFFKQMLTFLI